MNVSMFVIPEPAANTRTVLVAASRFPPKPQIIGSGAVNLTCGGCGQVLAEGLESADRVENVVVQCPVCEKFNETRI